MVLARAVEVGIKEGFLHNFGCVCRSTIFLQFDDGMLNGFIVATALEKHLHLDRFSKFPEIYPVWCGRN